MQKKQHSKIHKTFSHKTRTNCCFFPFALFHFDLFLFQFVSFCFASKQNEDLHILQIFKILYIKCFKIMQKISLIQIFAIIFQILKKEKVGIH